MTHDELTAILRGVKQDWADHGACPASPVDKEIADRLDRYRDLLRRCEWRLPCSAMREDIAVLQRDIQEAIK